MNTLTSIEAERVLQILRHAVDRLHILSYLPTEWDGNLLSDLSVPPVIGSLERLWDYEEQLKSVLDHMSPELGGRDISITKQLHRYTRAACRNLQADRDSLQVLMSRPESRAEDFTKFIHYLNELKSHIHSKLTTTVEEEATNRNLLHDLTEKERLAEESRDALQAQLAETREEKERVTFGLDQTLRKLQLELQDLTQLNQVEMEAVERDMSEAVNKATGDHELRMKQLQDQVEGLERQLGDLSERNREEELRLRKDKGRVENAESTKIMQYDEDMNARRQQLEDLQSTFDVETSEYAILKEYFDKVDADLGRNEEEESILAAVSRREAFGMNVLCRAVIIIQKIARGRRARAEVAKLRAKKRKGKKKGKGKKGKK
mmetsp:Transcript_37471/g.38157  ORF Transcript_37471/g.38157 Transcript_37471/m.38157 type:complete len:376 (+) Transcript_37471:136-1263(+)|eukprot:CAMPEP_0182430710 /NCGR_PEP_ID=MMETSP1167-20130531/42771_1 /TAXON_ID=2988 /ORGANISM="Mallomonas Sp, Strain CCMP3275" /LENGTH=375 /DNA_ID=CAMNT_0024616119 /DNA_START=52 /DNA_END=1179 /DNA_ORIENTATION=+